MQGKGSESFDIVDTLTQCVMEIQMNYPERVIAQLKDYRGPGIDTFERAKTIKHKNYSPKVI